MFDLTLNPSDIMEKEEFELKKAENESHEVWSKIILHPANFENLITANGSGEIGILSNKIAKVYNEEENSPMYEYINPM